MKARRHRAILSIVAALGGPLFLAGAEGKSPIPKTHVLFLGADLSVQYDKKVYRVEDVTGSELKIHVDQQEVLVPTRRGPVGLQVHANLKLAGTSVQLDQLHSGPAYTYENDPARKIEEASHSAMNAAAGHDMAQIRQVQSNDNLVAAQIEVANHPDSAEARRVLTNAQLDVGNSQQQMDITDMAKTSDVALSAAGVRRMQAAEGNFDAMEVSFKISSPVEMNNPYLVVLFKFHDPREKPGTDGLVIHAQALDPVDATPRYVRVLKGGLPIGFKMVDCTVHIYNRGEEVATNVSANRVELSRTETQQYIVMEHIGGHKGATVPAAVVSGSLSSGTRQRLSPEQLKRRLYVKVSKDGLLLGVFSDEGCTLPVDEAVTTAALGEVFFTPALQAGKPADGVARVRLGDI